MAKVKPKPKFKPKPRTKPKTFSPSDFLRGSKNVGQKYTAWDTYGQGKPNFGKGVGPGSPYREVVKANTGSNATSGGGWTPPRSPGQTYNRPRSGRLTGDPRTSAIRRRLGWI